jgi:SsrA-binding protein
MAAKKKDDDRTVVAENRKARFNYFIEEVVEAGIQLTGTEVKSLRGGKATIAESYAQPKGGEMFLINSYIPEYTEGNRFNHEPRRIRKLLLHKRQIEKLAKAVEREGMTIVQGILQRKGAGEDRTWRCPRQEASRQARYRKEARLAAREGSPDPGQGLGGAHGRCA